MIDYSLFTEKAAQTKQAHFFPRIIMQYFSTFLNATDKSS